MCYAHERRARSFGLLLVAGSLLSASPATAMPDLSQYADPSWLYYCAPTSGANVAYELGFGGAPGDAPTATAIINDLASKMNTNVGSNGTSHTDLRDGLDLFLETASGNPAGNVWNTQLFLTASQPGGGNDMWNIIIAALGAGGEGVLILDWPGSPPNGPEGQEAYEDPGIAGRVTHAVSLDGFTAGGSESLSFMDPGNNIAHVFPPVTADSSPIFRDSTKLELTQFPGGGGNPVVANVVGVVTTIMPEPATAALLVVGVLTAIGAGRRSG